MTTFTKEQLIAQAWKNIHSLESLKKEARQEPYVNDLDYRSEIERDLALARIALASLQVEPVGEFYECKPGYWHQRLAGDKAPEWTPLYSVAPAQISPQAIENAIENIRSISFYINEDDCNGKHIVHFLRQALLWLEGDYGCPAMLHNEFDRRMDAGNHVMELTMLVKRLACSLKGVNKSSRLPDKAIDYLERNGLIRSEALR
ncbi:TPA: hypothetical protein RMT71_005035 [Escherichia coli]|nr:hypothetical protein [Escherichia coli]HBQ4733185.1 hypothetical protein [Escherichia coli]HDW3987899.1 hypothetical protein [Escherichia coli]